MNRYFLEFISGNCILHQDGCFTYGSHREALAWERREDLGELGDPREALARARQKYHECSPCYCCFPADRPRTSPLPRHF